MSERVVPEEFGTDGIGASIVGRAFGLAMVPTGRRHGTAAVGTAVLVLGTMPSRTRRCSIDSVPWLRVNGMPALGLGAMIWTKIDSCIDDV